MTLKLVPTEMTQPEGWFEETESDLKLVPIALAQDGWREERGSAAGQRKPPVRLPDIGKGDRVLYRCGMELVPAVLVETAVGGWWARDSRHGRGLFRLAEEDVVTRLSRPDLLGEVA